MSSYPTGEQYHTNNNNNNNSHHHHQQNYEMTSRPNNAFPASHPFQQQNNNNNNNNHQGKYYTPQPENHYNNNNNNTTTNEVQQNGHSNIVTGEEMPYEKLQLMQQINFDANVVREMMAKNPTCWICCQPCDPNAPMGSYFKPCACGAAHRSCWWTWHRATMSAKTWWSCETCLRDYKYETLPGFDPTSAQESEITSSFQKQLTLFYIAMFSVIGLVVAFTTIVSYFSDKTQYNIPIGMKYILTSVVDGVPSANTTEVWRATFASGVAIKWPFYLLLGVLITSLLVIFLFLCNVCYEKCCEDDDTGGNEYDAQWKVDARGNRAPRYHNRVQDRTCSQQCHCSNSSFFFCWWCTSRPAGSLGGGGGGAGHVGHSTCDTCCNANLFDSCCSACTCSCPKDLPCGGCCSCCEGGGNKCNGCAGKCSLPEGDGGPVIAIVIIIVAIAIILSAVVIIVYVATTRFARFHADVSDALYCRTAELHGKMLVLGEGESLRSTNEV